MWIIDGFYTGVSDFYCNVLVEGFDEQLKRISFAVSYNLWSTLMSITPGSFMRFGVTADGVIVSVLDYDEDYMCEADITTETPNYGFVSLDIPSAGDAYASLAQWLSEKQGTATDFGILKARETPVIFVKKA